MPIEDTRRVEAKGIEIGSNGQALKSLIRSLAPAQVPVTNILALTIRTLEGAAEMVTRIGTPEAYIVLNLGKRFANKSLRHGHLEAVKRMREEAHSTPRSPAGPEIPLAVPITGTEKSCLKRDMFLTCLTRHVQLPPPCLAIVEPTEAWT